MTNHSTLNLYWNNFIQGGIGDRAGNMYCNNSKIFDYSHSTYINEARNNKNQLITNIECFNCEGCYKCDTCHGCGSCSSSGCSSTPIDNFCSKNYGISSKCVYQNNKKICS